MPPLCMFVDCNMAMRIAGVKPSGIVLTGPPPFLKLVEIRHQTSTRTAACNLLPKTGSVR